MAPLVLTGPEVPFVPAIQPLFFDALGTGLFQCDGAYAVAAPIDHEPAALECSRGSRVLRGQHDLPECAERRVEFALLPGHFLEARHGGIKGRLIPLAE